MPRKDQRLSCEYVISSTRPSPLMQHDSRFTDDGEPRWHYRVARQCASCGEWVVTDDAETELSHRDAVHSDEEVPDNCDRGQLEQTNEPVHNYGWPIELRLADIDDAAISLRDLPLVIVTDSTTDEQYLVLSGGGMDYSAEIAAAYVALGFMPPATIELPDMAGRKYHSAEWAPVARACIESQMWLKRHATWAAAKLRKQLRRPAPVAAPVVPSGKSPALRADDFAPARKRSKPTKTR